MFSDYKIDQLKLTISKKNSPTKVGNDLATSFPFLSR